MVTTTATKKGTPTEIYTLSPIGPSKVSGGRRENQNQTGKHHMSMFTILADLGNGLQGGLGALGAAIGVGLIGMKASEAVGRNPGAATKILIQSILSTAFAEGIVFFALFLGKS
jgi:F-type H+-transporting ATPase subunit c